MSKFLHFLFFLSLTILWTFYAILQMLLQFLKNPISFFAVKERTKIPEILTRDWKHHFVRLSEVKLHYVEAGDTNKPLMLMLHGFPEFWYSWRHQIRAFQTDYRVVAVDMRGYGQSDKPSGISNYSIAKLTNDVKELVAVLGSKSCVLVAHDWGAVVAWQTVLLYPEIVDKLIICNCPHPKAFGEFIKGGSWKQMLKSWYMFFFQCPYLPELFLKSQDFKFFDLIFTDPKSGGCRNLNAFTNEDLEAWKYTYSQPGALEASINYYRAAMRRIGQVRSKSFQVEPPTLIIWGTNDIALHENLAIMSSKYCVNGTVRLIEGASHWVQQDEPKLTTQYMKEFLKH